MGPRFPVLEPETLRPMLPPAAWDQVQWSPVSELWFTWNAIQLLRLAQPESWWTCFELPNEPSIAVQSELLFETSGALLYIETRLHHREARDLIALASATGGQRPARHWVFTKSGPRQWTPLLKAAWLPQPADGAVLATVKKELRRRAGEEPPREHLSPEEMQRSLLRSRRRNLPT